MLLFSSACSPPKQQRAAISCEACACSAGQAVQAGCTDRPQADSAARGRATPPINAEGLLQDAGLARFGETASAGQPAQLAAGASARLPTTTMITTPPDVVEEPNDEANYVFDETQLRTYNLIVTVEDLASIDANPAAEAYIPAQMEHEGKTYGPYRMRYKGSGGAFEPPCTLAGATTTQTPKVGKCSIKVDFDVDNGATFHGLKKLNFHSMNHDPSMMREHLAYGLYREMGIAAPRTAYARLLINGQLEGLFVLVEQIDGRFARARFGDGGHGNVYKEVWPVYSDPSIYMTALETNTKAPAVQGMLDFKAAADSGIDAFTRMIDRDYLLRYMAVDRVTENDDGIFHFFCLAGAQGNNPGPFGNHNYYWYEGRAAQRFWLIPWDLDLVFEARIDDQIYPEWTTEALCKCGYPMFGIQRPASCDTIVKYLRSWLDDYNLAVDQFIAGPFAGAAVQQKLDMWSRQIRGVVMEAAGIGGAPTFAAWTLATSDLQSKIASAREHRGRAY